MVEVTTDTEVWNALEQVLDPELPVVSVVELGIVRGVVVNGDAAHVTITPTYSGCPAMETIARDISAAVGALGLVPHIQTVLSPAWTTDWVRDSARDKLKSLGIASPAKSSLQDAKHIGVRLRNAPDIGCPRCDSPDIERLSQFGSTACKALYRCLSCCEPFDYFKAI